MDFEYLCYLIACREKANLKRRRLLYRRSKAERHLNTSRAHYIKKEDELSPETRAYRDHANHMKRITKEIYSPLRKKLGVKIWYNACNGARGITYEDRTYSINEVQCLADGHIFNSIVLENKSVNNPYLIERS